MNEAAGGRYCDPRPGVVIASGVFTSCISKKKESPRTWIANTLPRMAIASSYIFCRSIDYA